MEAKRLLIAAIIGAFTINPTKTLGTTLTVEPNSVIRTFKIGNDTYDSFNNKPNIKTGDILKIEHGGTSVLLKVTDNSTFISSSRSLNLVGITLGSRDECIQLGREIATLVIYYCRNKLDIESTFTVLIEAMNRILTKDDWNRHLDLYKGIIGHIKDHNEKEQAARISFGLFANGKVYIDLNKVGKSMADLSENEFIWNGEELKHELSETVSV